MVLGMRATSPHQPRGADDSRDRSGEGQLRQQKPCTAQVRQVKKRTPGYGSPTALPHTVHDRGPIPLHSTSPGPKCPYDFYHAPSNRQTFDCIERLHF